MFRSMLFGAVVVMLGASVTAHAADEPGRAVFDASKCNECHKITTLGLKSKGDAPDLAGVGDRHPTEWMKKFLLKQETTEKGKKHKKKFPGSDADLDTLVGWLSTLKK